MKYLIIGVIAVIILTFFYCVGELNKKWDDSFIDREWEKEFEKEQDWD